MSVSATGTPPGMFAVVQRVAIGCFSACLAIPPPFRTFSVKRMSFVALRAIPAVFAVRLVGGRMVRHMIGAIPVMRATRRCGMSTGAFGTIPTAVRRTRGTDGMVSVAGTAPPVIGTTRFGRETFVRRAKSVAAVGTLRQRRCVFLLTPGAIPIMRANGIQSIRGLADIAIPLSFNDFRRYMPGFVRPPPHVRTICFRRINAFAIFSVAPTVLVRAGIRL